MSGFLALPLLEGIFDIDTGPIAAMGRELGSQQLAKLLRRNTQPKEARVAEQLRRNKQTLQYLNEREVVRWALYRLVKSYVGKGGFLIDQIRDKIDDQVLAKVAEPILPNMTPEQILEIVGPAFDKAVADEFLKLIPFPG